MQRRLAIALALTASSLLAATCGRQPEPWAAGAQAWAEAWFEARSEGISNELPFYADDVLWEDRTSGHVHTDRGEVADHVLQLDVGSGPPVLEHVFVSADELAVSSHRDTPSGPSHVVTRVRIGEDGIERVVASRSIGTTDTIDSSGPTGPTGPNGPTDLTIAADTVARRWLSYWNRDPVPESGLYAPRARIEDSLLGASVTGADAIDAAVGSQQWPALAPVSLSRPTVPLLGAVDEPVFVGPALRQLQVDEIALLVTVEEPACPHLIAVFLGWTGEHVVWERRLHDVDTARRCESVEAFAPGWWEGRTPPEPVTRDITGVATVNGTDIAVEVANGTPALHRAVATVLEDYVDAGIGAPPVSLVAFVEQRSRCAAWDGFTTLGPEGAVVNICLTQEQLCVDDACRTLEHHARLVMLHELAHVWLEAHVDEPLRRAFVEFVGVEAWNDHLDPWARRGMEVAANTIAVGVARDLGPDGCDDGRYCDVTTGAYELLTGMPLPAP